MKQFVNLILIFLKTIVKGIATLVVWLFFLILLAVIVVLFVFVLRYETWMSKNRETVDNVAVEEVRNRDVVSDELDKRLKSFGESKVQRESLSLTCDMLTVLVEDVFEEGWQLSREETGVSCGNRSMTIYLKLWDLWWVTVNIWQRAEGEPDFVVYDVNIGPFSLAGATFGYLSREISRGVEDAIDLVSGDTYSGRKIEKLFIDEGGMRAVGVREEHSDDGEDELQ